MSELRSGGLAPSTSNSAEGDQHLETNVPEQRTWLRLISLAAFLAAAFSLFFIYPWLVNDPEVANLRFGPNAPAWVFVVESFLFLLLGLFAWAKSRFALHIGVLIVLSKVAIFVLSIFGTPGFAFVPPDVVTATWAVAWFLLVKHLYGLVQSGHLT